MTMTLDIAILEYIQTLRTPLLDQTMIFFSTIGNLGLVWIIITLSLLISKRYRDIGIMCLLALLIHLLLTNALLKPLIARLRPYAITGVDLIVPAPHDYSFPSGHTSSSFAIAIVLLINHFKIKRFSVAYLAIALAVLISFSRLYLYLHFVTDVIGGLVLGVLYGYLAVYLYKTHLAKYLNRSILFK